MTVRINKYLAQATGMSRRSADAAVTEGRVFINGEAAFLGSQVTENAIVTLDGQPVSPNTATTNVLINKPVGYVCSRTGQGSRTVYDLLPPKYSKLKPVGRLDKDSSGVLLLTDDGLLSYRLTHPKHTKDKVYIVTLDSPLSATDVRQISEEGVKLEDGTSKLALRPSGESPLRWRVTMHEGRNRQIRRTFAAVGRKVQSLQRIQFGDYDLEGLPEGGYREI